MISFFARSKDVKQQQFHCNLFGLSIFYNVEDRKNYEVDNLSTNLKYKDKKLFFYVTYNALT